MFYQAHRHRSILCRIPGLCQSSHAAEANVLACRMRPSLAHHLPTSLFHPCQYEYFDSDPCCVRCQPKLVRNGHTHDIGKFLDIRFESICRWSILVLLNSGWGAQNVSLDQYLLRGFHKLVLYGGSSPAVAPAKLPRGPGRIGPGLARPRASSPA